MKVKFKECQKQFETTNAARRYCSDVCSAKSLKRNMALASKRRYHRLVNALNRVRTLAQLNERKE